MIRMGLECTKAPQFAVGGHIAKRISFNEYAIKQLALVSRWQSVYARIKHIYLYIYKFNLKSKPVSFDRSILQIRITRNIYLLILVFFVFIFSREIKFSTDLKLKL